jgi:SAM-dependent methyltransferase
VAVCRTCGAGVTLPRADADELARFYPEQYGPYDVARTGLVAGISRLIQAWQGRRALASPPLAPLAGREPGRVVDVGCGRGDLAAYLTGRGWRVTGIEPSASGCEAARSRGIDTRQGTAEDVELEPGAYDAAIFRHSLEHVTEPAVALGRIRSSLCPGGRLLISVPNFGCWQRRRFGNRWYHLDLPRHRVHFTEWGLERLFERTGFEPTEITTSTSSVGLPATIQYALAGRCLLPSGLPLRIAAGLAAIAWPLSRAADWVGGGGDVLEAAARRRD